MRPNFLATKLALSHEHHDNFAETDSDSDSDSDTDTDDKVVHEKDEMGEDENEEDQEVASLETRKCETPKKSTRSGRKVKPANYDMKQHPMDTMLRRLNTAKRAARVQSSRKGEKVQETNRDLDSCLRVDPSPPPEPQRDPAAEKQASCTSPRTGAQRDLSIDLADMEGLGKHSPFLSYVSDSCRSVWQLTRLRSGRRTIQ